MANNSSNSSSKATSWFIVGFIVLVTAGVIIAGALSSKSSSSSSSAAANTDFVVTTIPALTALDWKLGNTHATVSLVEYGDFECPACAEYAPLVKQIVQANSTTIIYSFRNFPLSSIHPNATISAQAVEAAGLQGKFWEMHDLLYTKQNDWASSVTSEVVSNYFDGYAKSLGLDVNKFNTDINSAQVLGKVKTDVAGGNAAAIDHTPTFFINLKQIQNPTSYKEFQAAIDAALAATSTGSTSSTSGATSSATGAAATSVGTSSAAK